MTNTKLLSGNAIIYAILNVMFIGLIILGSVYLSAPPVPLTHCTYVSVNCDILDIVLAPAQNANIQFIYYNDTEAITAYYSVIVQNKCLFQNPCCQCCVVGYSPTSTPTSSYYCAINKQNATIVDNWYYQPSGPNIVYVVPLIIGLVCLLIVWWIFYCIICNRLCCDKSYIDPY
jgi:hypothetical protein